MPKEKNLAPEDLLDMDDLPEEESLLFVLNNHVYFYQEITRSTALIFNKIVTELYYNILHTMLSSGLTNPEIHLHFNSPGGELFGAMSMLKTVEKVKAGLDPIKVPMKIITHIDGESSSGSSIVSIAGDRRYMGENSCIMIHNAFSGVSGDPRDIEDHRKNTDLLVSNMKKIYKRYSKITDDELNKMLEHNCYIPADECLKLGLVDEII